MAEDGKPMGKTSSMKSQLKHMAQKAYQNIKKASSKIFNVKAIKNASKKSHKDNADEVLQEETYKAYQPTALGPANPQSNSILFKLPQEIRDKIYRDYFSCGPIQFGQDRESKRRQPANKPRRHHLALLECCRRIRTEIGASWLGYIDLHFGTPEIMLQKLLTIPWPLSSIRYVQVSDLMGPMVAARTASRPQAEVFLHEFLRVLEGLRLDKLVVVAGLGHLPWEYLAVKLLIQQSNGWRRLEVAFQRSHLIDETASDHQQDCYDFLQRYGPRGYRRQRLPDAFMKALRQRDGPKSRPTVEMVQDDEWPFEDLIWPKVHVHRHHSLPAPLCRNFHQYPKHSYTYIHNGYSLLYPLWVLVKRGQGVDYTVPPLRPDESEHWAYLQTKKRIQGQGPRAVVCPDVGVDGDSYGRLLMTFDQ
ncbi:hypothetical protein PG996_003342 [Apiospora saccharicola]|uniref:F-box domain-containing protein n=1 Tax=Apiospora saccharicola TaxID=335842 RepID=A0ABR1W111_9PEZI